MKRVVASLVVSLTAAVCWAGDAGRLIRVERRAQDDLTALRAVGIPVVLETRPCLIVRGGSSDLADLTNRGYKATVLDDAATTHDYVVVGVRPDSDLAAVLAAGSVILAEENWLLIRVPPGASLEPFEEARAFAGLVPRVPAALPKAPGSPDERAALLVPDPIVQKMVQGVADADIQAYWNAISTNPPTGTRASTSQGCRDASAYCLGVYNALKVPAQYQTWDAGNAPNVIGTLTGAVNPGNVYIVEAHLDDLPSSGVAPGGNDDASGSAAVLAAAKALSCWGVRNTVKFLNVTGEEDGLFGSDAYAADAATRGENILGVVNLDMIGWQGDGIPSQEDLDLDFNTPSQWLAQLFADASSAYGTGLPVNPILCPGFNASDHYPFWQRGWSAVSGITDNEGYCGAAGNYPYYHTANDTIANSGNPTFYYKVVRTTVATLGELADPFKISFGAQGYACGASLGVTLADRDLNTSPTSAQTGSVRVWSATEPAGETLTVTERGVNAMLFDGTMPTTIGPAVSGDGKLSVSPGDVVHAEYVDALDCDGTVNVTYAATASLDCAAPAISAVSVSGVTGISAHVTWTTNEAATSVVHYGTTPPGNLSASSSALVTTHDVGLTGLAECTTYVSWVDSADAVGNTATDNAGGAYYPFTTMKNTTPTYASTDTPIAIPDNTAAGITSTINVVEDKIVQDVNVTVNITHTYDADLTMSLIPPSGAPITLSALHGSSGDNYANTVFDDAASTPIAAGSAPFTGTFRPDQPLSAANGIHSVGAWKLKVVDGSTDDVGTLNGWSLSVTYPPLACGAHAAYSSSTGLTDTCAGGGAGNANGVWDPGERVQLKVAVVNDGIDPLTGVTATLTSTTPGVVVRDGTASYPDLAAGVTADSLAPHYQVYLPTSLACGSIVAFNLTVRSAQGSWISAFTRPIGTISSSNGTMLDESFASGIPATWTVVNGGSGGGAAQTWTTANPGGRTFLAPLASPVAIVDSDNAGPSASQDEQLITPVMNLSTATAVTLEFDQFFRWFSGGLNELGDVDVRSSLTGGAWVNLLRNQGVSSANPDHRTINITAKAAGAADVQVRFHYYQAAFEYYWQVDNVKVTYTAPGACNAVVCAGAAPAPPPVPDGTFGSPMRASRIAVDGSSLALTWDVASCVSSTYKALYGNLASVATGVPIGAACGLGSSGSATLSAVPPGNLWFVVVASDGAGTEGTWGSATSGPTGGNAASGFCGDGARANTGTCP